MATTTAWADPFVGLGDMGENSVSCYWALPITTGGLGTNSLSPFMSSLWHLDRPYMSLYLLPTFNFSLYSAKYSVGYFTACGCDAKYSVGYLPPTVTALSTVLGTCRL